MCTFGTAAPEGSVTVPKIVAFCASVESEPTVVNVHTTRNHGIYFELRTMPKNSFLDLTDTPFGSSERRTSLRGDILLQTLP